MRTVLLVLALGAASLLHAQERTLAWKSLDVTAKLAADGTLAISERHRMRFDGNWNGGERIFRIDPGQQLQLSGMSRVDQNGDIQPMAEAIGSGIGLHHYRFDGETLRWRAREASDPPFRNAERVYVIDYSLRNVVRQNARATHSITTSRSSTAPGRSSRFPRSWSSIPRGRRRRTLCRCTSARICSRARARF